MLHKLGDVREQGGERVHVAGGDYGVEAGGVGGRGVRSYPAAGAPRRRPGHPAFGRPGGERVEAGERLVYTIVVEILPTGRESIAAESAEREERPLVSAAAAIRADAGQPCQERVRSQGENIVHAVDEVRGEFKLDPNHVQSGGST